MRGRGAGCAAVLLMLLSGCGDGGQKADGPPKRETTAAGADGHADPGKVFTDAELKAALLPAKAIGPRAKKPEITLGLFNRQFGSGDWSACEPGDGTRAELAQMRGASAEQWVRPDPDKISEGDPYVYERLVSMPAERAGHYLDLRRQLHEACPRVTVDTEAAPVDEHHEARDLPDLGDEAVLETTRTTGGDEYDGTPHYEAEVRVGGVLVIVGAGTDKDLTIASAAQAVVRVRTELYKAL
ncbi:hypothetical protein AB0O76_08250 [Streptomyces sp. NPDC086554]|uniref:hypothetical protein n=1 Tax=Streptomyces sp. NPDC086554 TaxID=3154864 RepID=UPI00344AD22A